MYFVPEDIHKLTPEIYLNDTVINYYLELLKKFMLPVETASKLHVFNTYLLDKLMNTNRLESVDLDDP